MGRGVSAGPWLGGRPTEAGAGLSTGSCHSTGLSGLSQLPPPGAGVVALIFEDSGIKWPGGLGAGCRIPYHGTLTLSGAGARGADPLGMWARLEIPGS